jgi:hypothetical protein
MALNAWIMLINGSTSDALALSKQAADLEDSLDKSPVTPGAVIPARELYGDMLILQGKYSKAVTAYKASLAINPNRLNSVTGMKKALLNLKAI